jgi:protein-S-isoprenylcysteine O-methyltransferase Ste14
MAFFQTVGWIACVLYSTIPSFWLLIHPRAEFWRSRRQSPYRILVPAWIAMWIVVAAVTYRWRGVVLSENRWILIPSVALFCLGLLLYQLSHIGFSLKQLGGLPEILPHQNQPRLVRTGIRARVRHPVYLGHLCEMLAWSLGTGLVVCWGLTAFAIITGSFMIALEDAELEKRFGEEFRRYRSSVPAILPATKINLR